MALPDGTFRGGPAFYIERGLGSRRWGMVFALLLIFTFGLAFNAVQANTIAAVLRDAHTVPTQFSGIVLALLAAPVFFGGVRAVARVAEWLLPAMALAYIALALVMLALHLDHVPAAFLLIVRSAFGLQPAIAGVSGGIAAAMLNGVKRGLFSNEAGMGSAPNTAATATVAHPAIQGFIQALGVFIDTIIVCSTTAFIILVSGLYDPSQPAAIAGASLTQAAIAQSFGVAGQWFVTVVVFAWTDGELLIWISSNRPFHALSNLGNAFEKEIGAPVKIETQEQIIDSFQSAAQSGKGPDIFFWANDRIGEWADSGLLKPLDIKEEFRAKYLPMSWDAVTHKRQVWGYPVALEAASLIYNKKLVTGKVPTQLSELPAFGKELNAFSFSFA